MLRDAQVHMERAKLLDPDGLVPQMFLQQVSVRFKIDETGTGKNAQISFLSTSSKSSEHDSDEEEISAEATGNPNKRVKR